MVLLASAAQAGAHRSSLSQGDWRGGGCLSSSPLQESDAPRKNLVDGTIVSGYPCSFRLEEKHRAVSYAAGVSGILRFGESVPVVAPDFIEELRVELTERRIRRSSYPSANRGAGDQVELADGPCGE